MVVAYHKESACISRRNFFYPGVLQDAAHIGNTSNEEEKCLYLSQIKKFFEQGTLLTCYYLSFIPISQLELSM